MILLQLFALLVFLRRWTRATVGIVVGRALTRATSRTSLLNRCISVIAFSNLSSLILRSWLVLESLIIRFRLSLFLGPFVGF